MFDIGFLELLVVGVVSLLVLGPEKLPHAARLAGAYWGKARRFWIGIQATVAEQVEAQERLDRIKALEAKQQLTHNANSSDEPKK
jgi:sec-independent protein translocase protein TatB